jgi:hypothetical protein
LEKVLILVGETALSVSSRKLAPFPKLRGVDVFTDSFGRGLHGIIGSEVVMSGGGAGDGSKDGGIECDIVDSIMWAVKWPGGQMMAAGLVKYRGRSARGCDARAVAI